MNIISRRLWRSAVAMGMVVGVPLSVWSADPPTPAPSPPAPAPAPALPAAAPRPVNVPTFAQTLRLSALIKGEAGVKVGLSDTKAGWNKFIPIGDKYNDIEVVSADYDKESVLLRKGDETVKLYLDRDPNAPESTGVFVSQGETNVWKGEGIEAFLQDHPEAILKTPAIPPPSDKPVVGMGEGIEKALKEHPELRVNTNALPEGSMGEGIEKALKEHPELAEKIRQPVVGKGEGIESYLKVHPEAASNVTEGASTGMGPGIDKAVRDQSGKTVAPTPAPATQSAPAK